MIDKILSIGAFGIAILFGHFAVVLNGQWTGAMSLAVATGWFAFLGGWLFTGDEGR